MKLFIFDNHEKNIQFVIDNGLLNYTDENNLILEGNKYYSYGD